MNIRATIFVISNNVRALSRAPLFDDLPRKKCDTRRHEIIIEEIPGSCPCPLPLRPEKMNGEVRGLRENHNEGSRPRVT